MEDKNIEDIYELSPMQQGMLFHTIYTSNSEVYFEQLLCTLKGAVETEAFQQAWQAVVSRHPILRSAFYWENVDEPLQVVEKQVDIPWSNYYWQDLAASEQSEHLEELLRRDRALGLDLEQAPCMRFSLIKQGSQRYQLLWSHHHILLDGWSMAIVLKDVLTLYDEKVNQKPSSLIEPRPYRDYIQWLQQQDLSAAERFWQKTLQGFTTPTAIGVYQLKADNPNSPQSQKQHFHLSLEQTQALQTLSRHHCLTLNTVLQGAWSLLLSRYSGETDVLFGVTVSGRSIDLSGIESMVGLFINSLPTRVQVRKSVKLFPWLQKLQSQHIEQEQYDYLPLAHIQTLSNVPRGIPLFESLLVFENYPHWDTPFQGNLEIEEFKGIGETNYPLTVIVSPNRELSIKIVYHSGHWEQTFINQLMKYFHQLLVDISQNSDRNLGSFLSLFSTEEEEILVHWNRTAKRYPTTHVHHLFEQQAIKKTEAIAVIDENQQLTYSALNQRANQLANTLLDSGIKTSQRIGMCIEKCIDAIVSILAILKVGAVYVPLDPTYPLEYLSHLVEDAQLSVILTQQKWIETLPNNQKNIINLDNALQKMNIDLLSTSTFLITPGEVAYVIYTSGTTGKPKGVCITHRGLSNLAFAQNEYFEITFNSRVLQFASFNFDASISEIFVTLIAGATLILVSSNALTPGIDLLKTLKRYQISHVTLPPSALAVLPLDDLPTLKTLVVAGEPCPTSLVKQWSKGRRFLNAYGPTEGTVCATIAELTGEEKNISIGRPIANILIHILDTELKPVPIGVVGELYLGGLCLAQGYFNQPELTSEKFVSNPLTSEYSERLYKTGDLAYYEPNGSIVLLGRIDHQVKIRGFRIELGEIEATLAQHPHIKSSIVIVDEKLNILVYWIRQKTEIKSTEIRDFCKQKLPYYKVPSKFIVLEQFPLTPNGKVDRRALLKIDAFSKSLEEKVVLPRTSTELELAKIWCDLLHLQKISVQDNFFELGGHSLLATQVISRVRELYLIDMSVSVLFDYPTIAELSQKILDQQLEESDIADIEEILNEIED